VRARVYRILHSVRAVGGAALPARKLNVTRRRDVTIFRVSAGCFVASTFPVSSLADEGALSARLVAR